jgi:hypothetical protein
LLLAHQVSDVQDRQIEKSIVVAGDKPIGVSAKKHRISLPLLQERELLLALLGEVRVELAYLEGVLLDLSI